MFESLRHWIDSTREESKLFDHPDDETLHLALASLLYHLISADERHDGKERQAFGRIIKQEFDLTQEQVDYLYQAAKTATGDLHADLTTIHSHLKDKPTVRLRFMQTLLRIIDIHGAHPVELKLFYQTLHEIFPELKNVGRNEEL